MGYMQKIVKIAHQVGAFMDFAPNGSIEKIVFKGVAYRNMTLDLFEEAAYKHIFNKT